MKPIANFESYNITPGGLVWSSKRKRYKAPFKLRNGYWAVTLRNEMGRQNKTIHFLVLSTHGCPKPSPLHECRHIDGNKDNNHISNLEWGTRSQNHLDKKNHGTFQQGEKHGMHKLTTVDVLEIKSSSLPYVRLAEKFNVTPQAIKYAKCIGWKHLNTI